MSSHKGSWSRVNNHKDWADNYEQIFRKKINQSEEIAVHSERKCELTHQVSILPHDLLKVLPHNDHPKQTNI